MHVAKKYISMISYKVEISKTKNTKNMNIFGKMINIIEGMVDINSE